MDGFTLRGHVARAYDAGKNNRRLRAWTPPSAGPNQTLGDLQTIRNRTRDAVRNEWTAESATTNIVTDMVGTGVSCRIKSKHSAQKRKKYDELWDAWIKECDADNVFDFYGLQVLGVETLGTAGEFFFRFRPRRLEDGLKVPLQIQMLEPEMVPQVDYTLPSGNKVKQGIEFNAINRRVNYMMYREHPGENQQRIDVTQLTAIPADQVRHVYQPRRIGQLRGVPNGTSTLVRMKTVGDYDDAVVEKAKIQNLYVGVIKRPPPAPGSENTDPLTGQVIENYDGEAPMVSMEPGAVVELAPGEEMNFSTPPATGVGYNDFMRQQNLATSAGNGVPYEIMTGDIMNVSDRTLRVVIQQYRRRIEQKQWIVLIPMFCQAIRDAFVDAAVIAGLIPAADATMAKDVEWSPQAWAYIHPVQDVQAKVAEITAGITSRDAVIAGRGGDPEVIDQQRADAKKREEALGLSIVPTPAPDPAQVQADKKVADKQKADKAKAEVDLLTAQADSARAIADAEIKRADAYVQHQALLQARVKVDTELLQARLKESELEQSVITAKAEQIALDIELAKATSAYQKAVLQKESEARIADLKARADAAVLENLDRACAVKAAEDAAAEHRAQILATEKARTEVARLEVEAAKLGLQELRGE